MQARGCRMRQPVQRRVQGSGYGKEVEEQTCAPASEASHSGRHRRHSPLNPEPASGRVASP